jgi:hypothetical protein
MKLFGSELRFTSLSFFIFPHSLSLLSKNLTWVENTVGVKGSLD